MAKWGATSLVFRQIASTVIGKIEITNVSQIRFQFTYGAFGDIMHERIK